MASETAVVHLRVLGASVKCSLTLSPDPVPPQAAIPLAYAITDQVTTAAASASAARGHPPSCGKGCAACCRQAVTISPVECLHLADLVSCMPAHEQSRIRARFDSAIRRMRSAKLICPDSPDEAPVLLFTSGTTLDAAYNNWLDTYFDLYLDCPFLEDNCCTIYADRPAQCREYMVTSPRENCSAVGRQPTVAVDVPLRMSNILPAMPPMQRTLQKIPLVFSLAWSQAHQDSLPTTSHKDLITRLLQLIDASANTPFHARDQQATTT